MLGRRDEVERAIRTRVYAIEDPAEVADPVYLEGLKAAVNAAIDYCLAGVSSFESNPEAPPALLIQARVAAQSKVSLDTVLRRCLSGHAVLTDFLIEEARDTVGPRELARLLRRQASLFERLLKEIGTEYRRGEGACGERHLDRTEKWKLNLVRRLLSGERLDASGLGYELERLHVAVVGRAPRLRESLKALAETLGCGLLMVCPEEETAWGWLGFQEESEAREVWSHVQGALPTDAFLALGEPGQGLEGWRLSHRQACAALPMAAKHSEPLVRYADVALVASMRKDELLTTSLRELYLAPLESERDGGETLRCTLRAYFAARHNASSAAAALGVSRQTVNSRLRVIEERIGRSLDHCSAEVDAALRLHDLRDRAVPLSPARTDVRSR